MNYVYGILMHINQFTQCGGIYVFMRGAQINNNFTISIWNWADISDTFVWLFVPIALLARVNNNNKSNPLNFITKSIREKFISAPNQAQSTPISIPAPINCERKRQNKRIKCRRCLQATES